LAEGKLAGEERGVKEVWAMRFLLMWKVFESVTQEQVKPLPGSFAQGIEEMFDSPKVKDLGVFSDARGCT
jgi:hypothetical protein